MQHFEATDLILNADGSVYHLGVLPSDIADTIILVGDPARVATVSAYFDRIELKKQKREFVLHTGYLNNVRLSCLSTGMGTDNMDIAINEINLLCNTNLTTGTTNKIKRSLKLIRIGTSGSLRKEIDVDTVLVSKCAIASDLLMTYYDYEQTVEECYLQDAFSLHLRAHAKGIPVYASYCDKDLLSLFQHYTTGCTHTCIGFYGPQGRQLDYKLRIPNYLELLRSFCFDDITISNLEMETAALYALGKMFGHQCISVNIILANRETMKFSKSPNQVVETAVQNILDLLV